MNIVKETVPLLDPYYEHPNTSLLTFRFEPDRSADTEARLQRTSIRRASIAGKDLYVFDGFLEQAEREDLRLFSLNGSFSRNSYGSSEAIEQGERPAASMNGKERWRFFNRPPTAISQVYKLFSTLAAEFDANVSTLPWGLFNPDLVESPAVIANRLESASLESMELGKHRDTDPGEGLPFGIPVLYSSDKKLYPRQFSNGTAGFPWVISVMVYSTAVSFLPEYRLGTVFYDEEGMIRERVDCLNGRLVFFEGDLFHSIEASDIPAEIQTWRISYVFKMMINPKSPDSNLKKQFFDRFITRSGSHIPTR